MKQVEFKSWQNELGNFESKTYDDFFSPFTDKKKPLGYKCSVDGKYFVFFEKKTCRYCIPVYREAEMKFLKEQSE